MSSLPDPDPNALATCARLGRRLQRLAWGPAVGWLIFSSLATPAASSSSAGSWHLGLEIQQSQSSLADWAADFDRAGRRRAGLEARAEAALALARGPWGGRLGWRGRAAEGGRLDGVLLEATAAFHAGGVELGAGRGYPARDWVPCDEAALLYSTHAPPLDHLWLGLGPLRLPRSTGCLRADGFLGYLDDGDCTLPYPMLWGMRLAWAPAGWLSIEAQRAILLGGGGRTERLTLRDLADIFLGRGEGAAGPEFAVSDSDQKFAWLVRCHPQAWARRHGVDDLEIVWLYGGEDTFEGIVPKAPGRFHGVRVHPRPWWGVSLAYVSTADDRNQWYFHKVYRSGYAYRGWVLGHPLGGDARRWRGVAAACLTGDTWLTLALTRERRGYFWANRDPGRVPRGGFFGWEVQASTPWRGGRLTATIGARDAWGADRETRSLPDGYGRLALDLSGGGPGRAAGLSGDRVWGDNP